MSRKPVPKEVRDCERKECSLTFEVSQAKAQQLKRFCSKACSNATTASQRSESLRSGEHAHRPIFCPCGATVYGANGRTYNYTKKYCSDDHRKLYGEVGGPKKDLTKYTTFNCQNCEKEVTRYKKYGRGANKYCSNTCAQKHTKVKKHYGIEGLEIVFDSSWEVAFWGIAKIAKIPVERFDRQYAVEWKTGQWYAPDFWMPSLNLAIEVKGLEDPEDAEKWESFRSTRGDLVVMDDYRMTHLSPESLPSILRIAQLRDNPSRALVVMPAPA